MDQFPLSRTAIRNEEYGDAFRNHERPEADTIRPNDLRVNVPWRAVNAQAIHGQF